jgi:hypothetical protein
MRLGAVYLLIRLLVFRMGESTKKRINVPLFSFNFSLTFPLQ